MDVKMKKHIPTPEEIMERITEMQDKKNIKESWYNYPRRG